MSNSDQFISAVDAFWTQWGSWSTCSTSCGEGVRNDLLPLISIGHLWCYATWIQLWNLQVQSRSRDCNPAQNGGDTSSCKSSGRSQRHCHMNPCKCEGGFVEIRISERENSETTDGTLRIKIHQGSQSCLTAPFFFGTHNSNLFDYLASPRLRRMQGMRFRASNCMPLDIDSCVTFEVHNSGLDAAQIERVKFHCSNTRKSWNLVYNVHGNQGWFHNGNIRKNTACWRWNSILIASLKIKILTNNYQLTDTKIFASPATITWSNQSLNKIEID